MDFRCPKSYRLSYNISAKMQTQGSIAKKSKPIKSKLKELKPDNRRSILLCTNKLTKPTCYDKKEKY